MQIDAQRFEQGTSYAEYRTRILAGGGIMEELLTASEESLAKEVIAVEPFRRLPGTVRVLVLSEDWCGDCTDNLPILNRLAEESGKLDVRIVSRDDNLDIMDNYLKYGTFQAIPLILFLNDEGEVVGDLKERPESVTEVRKRKREELYAAHSEFGTPGGYADLSEETRAELQSALLALREETRSFAIQEVVRELAVIADRVSGN
jgi:thiol-disulfide isomerase/thioredoxin